ncbi:D-alanyl-D-alanine carboxypeptidase family protein [Patescibacteria group bacterium]
MSNKKNKLYIIAVIFLVSGLGWYFFGDNFKDEKKLDEYGSEVQGAQDRISDEDPLLREGSVASNNFFPIVDFQPIRKDEIGDLVLPNAHASLVLDVDSGTILHYQNGKDVRQIASLTKMMTAVMVLENVDDLDELVTIDEEVMYVDGTKIGCPRSGYCIDTRLQKGEKISARSLLKAMLMNSANDAATALGKYVGGGDLDKFMTMMNERAKELGLSDSHFCTPSGLEIDGREETCYSTAYDIARIAAHSMQYDIIWDTMQTSETIIYSDDKVYSHRLGNTNQLLGQVPNLLGGKTGFTPLAGRSLLMGAIDPTKKHRVVAVLLDDPYRWEDVRKMFQWTFDSYNWK